MISDSAKSTQWRDWRNWLVLACRVFFGGVLFVAGGLKIGDLEQSVTAVHAYDLFNLEISTVIGYALPIVEVVLGALLILGLFTRLAGLVGCLMMIAFIIGIAQAWARGISLDCGCFGGGGLIEATKTRYVQEIIRDIVFLVAGLVPVVRPKSVLAIDNWLFAPLPTSQLNSEIGSADQPE